MSVTSKKKSQTKRNALRSDQYSIWREITNECIAGATDSIFTQFCLVICYYLFQIDATQKYFKSPDHLYWICYCFDC